MSREVQALMLLDDGASYSEVAKTLGVDRGWVSKRFPGRGWTSQEGGAYGFMLRKANEKVVLR